MFKVLLLIINILDKKLESFYSLIEIKRVGMTRNKHGTLTK